MTHRKPNSLQTFRDISLPQGNRGFALGTEKSVVTVVLSGGSNCVPRKGLPGTPSVPCAMWAQGGGPTLMLQERLLSISEPTPPSWHDRWGHPGHLLRYLRSGFCRAGQLRGPNSADMGHWASVSPEAAGLFGDTARPLARTPEPATQGQCIPWSRHSDAGNVTSKWKLHAGMFMTKEGSEEEQDGNSSSGQGGRGWPGGWGLSRRPRVHRRPGQTPAQPREGEGSRKTIFLF